MTTTATPPFATVSAHPGPASLERTGADAPRPLFSAESMSPAARLGLLLFELSGLGLVVAFAAAAVVWPEGLLHFGTLGVVLFGVMLANVWAVHVIFGALLANDRTLGRSTHARWLLAMTLTGPVAILAYWVLHVWSAPHGSPRGR
jgi:hypothetical protein